MIDRVLKKYEHLKDLRRPWDSLLSEAARYSMPSLEDFFYNDRVEQGESLSIRRFQDDSVSACNVLTAGIFSYQMPEGSRWFELVPDDYELSQIQEVSSYLSLRTDRTQSAVLNSNFSREMYTTLHSINAVGTGCISAERIERRIVFKCHPITDIFFEENAYGERDTVFKRMRYTARQAFQRFKEKAGKSVIKAVEKNDETSTFEYVHAVFPKDDYDSSKIGKKGMMFTSVYINVDDKEICEEGGFKEMPYIIGTFWKNPGEIMGRSPGTESLPLIRMYEAISRNFIESSEKAVHPTLIVEDDGVIGQPRTGPDDILVIREGSMPPSVLNLGYNQNLNFQIIEYYANKVRESFFNHIFEMLRNYRNMTATEVNARYDEKLSILGPVVKSCERELLDPLIRRVINLLDEIPGYFPLRPSVDIDYKIQYQGKLSMIMSSIKANAIEVGLAKVSAYASQFDANLPGDLIDIDKAFLKMLMSSGIPADVIREESSREERREQRAADQQQQQQIQSAESISKSIRNIDGTGIGASLGI